MANHHHTTILQSFPFFVQIRIIMLIAKHSVESFQNVLTAFSSLGLAAKTPDVPKKLNFHELTVKSLTKIHMYQNLLSLSLSAGNLEALYLRGMEEYFKNENIFQGLEYLHLAAQGFYDNAIYLYGIIMLSRGQSSNRHPNVRFTKLESQQSKIRWLLAKHQDFYSWSKSQKI
ncbi:unnamed protein product [Eruca vesicaria subsp. sativa]|uniref:At2g35280-like TPR domain-containing protein n=1 Tax=Eruca vesicaria subsp. sativa TaxID=29727 RepID=A0ABC8KHX0_ERUVS|nr:unnamed protein product [Eruca vesicaria subsp. sativa]